MEEIREYGYFKEFKRLWEYYLPIVKRDLEQTTINVYQFKKINENQRYKPLNLDFEKFFSGKVIAKGNLMLKYPKKSVKNLHVTFKGSFQNNNLKLRNNI